MPSFLAPINLNQNEVQNALAQRLGADPGSPVAGQFWFNTSTNVWKYHNGSAAIDPLARANHSGTQTASTISDLGTTVRAYPLSSFAAPTANIPMAGFTLTGLGTPSAAGQAATYDWVISQVQASAAGISSKPPVVTVYTSNVSTLSGAAPTNDGVTPAAGSRVLLTGQTTTSQNGPWITASGSWARANSDGQSELETGAVWLVDQGTTYTGSQWMLATTGAITVGSTALTINRYGAGQAYTNGNGLTLTGNSFAVSPGTGISVGASVSVDTTVVARKYQGSFATDGSTSSWTVTHNLNNQWAAIFITNATTGDRAEFNISGRTTSALTLSATTAPATGTTYQYLVIG